VFRLINSTTGHLEGSEKCNSKPDDMCVFPLSQTLGLLFLVLCEIAVPARKETIRQSSDRTCKVLRLSSKHCSSIPAVVWSYSLSDRKNLTRWRELRGTSLPQLYYERGSNSEALLEQCPRLHRYYTPPLCAKNKHVHLIISGGEALDCCPYPAAFNCS
jgi:hypothetical protein